MAKPKGFATHHKSAKDAFAAGDHAGAAHHIGKMFAMNRAAAKGAMAPPQVADTQAPEPDPLETQPAIKPAPRGLGNWMQGGTPPKPAAPAPSPLNAKRAAFAKLRK